MNIHPLIICQSRTEDVVKPLLALAHGSDESAAEKAVADLSELGHHPVKLAVFNRRDLFRSLESFKYTNRVLNCWMHSWKEVVTTLNI